jgi:hypothetical protein
MTNSDFRSAFPFTALEAILSAEDDPLLWKAALSVVTDDFVQRYGRESGNKNWSIVVGACSHWLRPHQTRWTKAGGFAYPEGYKNFRPEFDWSVTLLFRDEQWVPIVRLPNKRLMSLHVVIPSRTSRHKQAAIYTRWYPSGETVFYGFRKLDGK